MDAVAIAGVGEVVLRDQPVPAARGDPQPLSAERALKTVTDIPRRSGAEGAHNGFDAFGALIVLLAAGAYFFEPAEYWARVKRRSVAARES